MLSVIKIVKWAPWLIIAALALYCWTLRGEVHSLELSAAQTAEQQANALAAAQSKARWDEAERHQAIITADAAYQRGRKDAQDSDRLVDAGIRDGSIELRRSAAIATANLSAATLGDGLDHAAARAELGRENVIFALGIAREGDDAIRQLTAAQSVIRSYQSSP